MDLPELHSLEDILKVLDELPAADNAAIAAAQAREPQLTKPAGSLGKLEEISQWLCGWQEAHPPRLERIAVHIFAGNHGITAQGVSAFPSEVTAQMVGNFKAGGAAINQLCKAHGANLKVFPIDLDTPTADFSTGPAMEPAELVNAFRSGWETVSADLDLLCVGMSLKSKTALVCVLMRVISSRHIVWCAAVRGFFSVGHQHWMWPKDSRCRDFGSWRVHSGQNGVEESPLR